jgi:hypothetical protein
MPRQELQEPTSIGKHQQQLSIETAKKECVGAAIVSAPDIMPLVCHIYHVSDGLKYIA